MKTPLIQSINETIQRDVDEMADQMESVTSEIRSELKEMIGMKSESVIEIENERENDKKGFNPDFNPFKHLDLKKENISIAKGILLNQLREIIEKITQKRQKSNNIYLNSTENPAQNQLQLKNDPKARHFMSCYATFLLATASVPKECTSNSWLNFLWWNIGKILTSLVVIVVMGIIGIIVFEIGWCLTDKTMAVMFS